MKKIYILAIASLLICAAAGALAFFALGLPFIAALNTAEVFVIAPLHLAITLLFVLALKAFKAKLKIAYGFICAATAFLAIGMLQYMVLGSVNALNSEWVTSGLVELPFALTMICIFTGMVLFARLMGAKNVTVYAWVVPILAIVAGLLALLIPSPRTDISLDTLYRSLAIYAFESVLILGATVMAFKARAKAGALYVPALAWMALGLVLYSPAVLLSVPVQIWLPNDHWYLVYGASTTFFLLGGLCYIKSAIELHHILYAEVATDVAKLSFFGKPLQRSAKTSDAIDAVVYLAGFVSNPTAIDPVLDGLRHVTASLATPGQKLTPTQQQELADVYRKLAQFLVTEEQVAKYTAEDLRARVDKRFANAKTDTFFWQAVES